jgi:phage shock protein E
MMNCLSGMLAALTQSPRRNTAPGPEAGTPSITLEPDAVLIDVRSDGEFASGHIAGAVSLPLDRLEQHIRDLVPDKATPLLLYCRSGARSARAYAIVQRLGYHGARNGGGIGSLSSKLGCPVTRN